MLKLSYRLFAAYLVILMSASPACAQNTLEQFKTPLPPVLLAMKVPTSAPRVTLLGEEAVLIEMATDLNKTHERMRMRWRDIQKAFDPSIFQPDNIPLPPHNRQQWAELVKRLPAADAMKKLRFINGFFNNIPSDADIDIYGEKEYWATPQEFLQNRLGDCEDYAITKFFALQHFGWPIDDLWIVLLHDKINDGMHAVLAAKTKKKVFILDNLSKPATLLIPEKQYSKQVKPYLLLNNQGVWFFPSSVEKG